MTITKIPSKEFTKFWNSCTPDEQKEWAEVASDMIRQEINKEIVQSITKSKKVKTPNGKKKKLRKQPRPN